MAPTAFVTLPIIISSATPMHAHLIKKSECAFYQRPSPSKNSAKCRQVNKHVMFKYLLFSVNFSVCVLWKVRKNQIPSVWRLSKVIVSCTGEGIIVLSWFVHFLCIFLKHATKPVRSLTIYGKKSAILWLSD